MILAKSTDDDNEKLRPKFVSNQMNEKIDKKRIENLNSLSMSASEPKEPKQPKKIKEFEVRQDKRTAQPLDANP